MSTSTTEPPGTGHEPPGSAGHVLVRFAHAVEDALDRVVDASCLSMSEGDAAEAVLGLTRVQARIAELRLRALGAADQVDVAKSDASASTGAWLAHQTRQQRGAAFADVKLAIALSGEFAATAAALAAGSILEEQARVIVKAVRDLPSTVGAELRRQAEDHLLGLCAEFDAAALAKLAKHLLQVLDPEEADRRLGEKLAEQERNAARKTYLELHDNGDGTTTGRFKIPTLTAAMLCRGLDALNAPRHLRAAGCDGRRGRVMHPDRHPLGADDRQHQPGRDGSPAECAQPAPSETDRKLSRPEKLGQAFCAFIERFPADRLPKLGGVNATVVVLISLDQLRGELQGACLLDSGEMISAGYALQLACEAGIVPAVLNSRGEVLHLGRKVRLFTEAQRLAMGIRDKGCTAEGCTQPAWRCEGHHKIPWSQGGATDLEDGTLLCPWHHHRAHDPRYRVEYLCTGKTRFHRRT